MKALSIVVLLVAVGVVLGRDAALDDAWNRWTRLHRRAYNGARDGMLRREKWEANVKMIQQHNLMFDLGEVTYAMGLNKFSDMDWDDFKAAYLPGLLEIPAEWNKTRRHVSGAPESKDWRTVGKVVTRVKDQGQYNQKAETPLEFSEQQLVDCSKENSGCHGGWMGRAFQFLKTHGLETEEDYPYQAMDLECRYDANKGRAKVASVVQIHRGSEDELKHHLGTVGPISIAINAMGKLVHFKYGIFSDKYCDPDMLNHGVLAVGYGSEDGKDYWIVKNSWGPTWGDEGFVKIARNMDNMCGVATAASYPVLQ